MKIFFEQKKPGRTRQSVQPIAIEIEGNPTTVRELIDATVRFCVAVFNNKAIQAPAKDNLDADTTHRILTQTAINDLAESGRVAFGIVYNGKTEDSNKAVTNAVQCYEDGLYRMFINGQPLGDLNTKIELTEGDCLTVVRLTLLAGRLW